MGIFSSCYTSSEETGSVEIAEIELYDEAQARAQAPGFDDALGEPFLVDGDDDGIGERVRPGTVVELRTTARWTRAEEQQQDGTGNAPSSLLLLTVFRSELISKGLLVDGKCSLRPNDRLLKLKNSAGEVRADFELDGRTGLFCYEVRPGETGESTLTLLFEQRRPVGR